MTILATMPGHFGDILWSLPTVRLLAARHGGPVDFMTSPKYSSILELVQAQPYILETWTGKDWDVSSEDTAQNRVPPACDCDDYEKIYHLGYQEWPTSLLAGNIRESVGLKDADPALALHEPWIHPVGLRETEGSVITVGFSEEHIELKMGVLLGMAAEFEEITWRLILPPALISHRAWEWVVSARDYVELWQADWEQAAVAIASADLFFGCLSSLWVLANAVGTPTVIMEPMVARHNPIFWRESPKNHMVIGNDGKPTFDRRHTVEMIDKVLTEIEEVESG